MTTFIEEFKTLTIKTSCLAFERKSGNYEVYCFSSFQGSTTKCPMQGFAFPPVILTL